MSLENCSSSALYNALLCILKFRGRICFCITRKCSIDIKLINLRLYRSAAMQPRYSMRILSVCQSVRLSNA